MPPILYRFQTALQSAGKKQKLSLQGSKSSFDAEVLLDVPEDIFKLGQLEELDISNNLLTRLPPELAQMSALKRIDIAFNSMAEIPNFPGLIVDSRQLAQFWHHIDA